MKPQSMEELSEALCEHCPLPEHLQGVHCYGGEPVMCVGSRCDDAYERYLEEFNESEES